MILWRIDRPGGAVIGMGLEAGNIAKLKKGQPIFQTLEKVGISNLAFTIHYGETKEDIIAEMKTHGLSPFEPGAAQDQPQLKPGAAQDRPQPPPPGATGAFPRGKLEASDEGELAAHLSLKGDVVYIDFGKDLSWLAMSKNEAKEFAARLLIMAQGGKDN